MLLGQSALMGDIQPTAATAALALGLSAAVAIGVQFMRTTSPGAGPKPPAYNRTVATEVKKESFEQVMELDGLAVVGIELDSKLIYLKAAGQTYAVSMALARAALARDPRPPGLIFVADGAGGEGARTALEIFRAAGLKSVAPSFHGWMAQLACALETNRVSQNQLTQMLDVCVSLELRMLGGPFEKPVAICVPGGDGFAVLAPLILQWYPTERWVFVYSSAVEAIRSRVKDRIPASHYESSSLIGLPSASKRLVAPSASVLGKRTLIQDRRFERHVKQLRACHRPAMDEWLMTVDKLLRLKDEEESENELAGVCFLPFMTKLEYIRDPSTREIVVAQLLDFASSKLRKVSGFKDSDKWPPAAPASLELERDIAAACEALEGLPMQAEVPWGLQALYRAEMEAVEETAFSHNSILLQNKTLLDTIVPKPPSRAWKLKASPKMKTCACCVDPEEAAAALAKMQAQMKAGTDFVTQIDAAAAAVPGAFAAPPGAFASATGTSGTEDPGKAPMPMLFDVNAKKRNHQLR